mgnify:CR=1 FL=1
MTPDRWTSLPVGIARHSTRDEDAQAAASIARGDWLPVSSGWDGFPVEGFVSPAVLDCIEGRIAEADRELAAASDRANDAEREADELWEAIRMARRRIDEVPDDLGDDVDAALADVLDALEGVRA